LTFFAVDLNSAAVAVVIVKIFLVDFLKFRGYRNSRGLAGFGSANYLAQDFKQFQIEIKSIFGYIGK
jgi:hypothetical protein